MNFVSITSEVTDGWFRVQVTSQQIRGGQSDTRVIQKRAQEWQIAHLLATNIINNNIIREAGDTRVIQISGQERYKRGDKSETLHCRLQILTTINSASATLLHRYVRYIVGRRFPAVSGNKMSYWLGQARCWWAGAMSRAGQHQGGHHHLHHQQYRYSQHY